MNISIKGTNLELTAPIKQYVNDKIGGLKKFLDPLEAKVELERDRHHHSGRVFRAEVTMIAGGKILRAEETAEDMYAAIDLVVPKLREQIAKFKDKKQAQSRRQARVDKI